MKSPITFREWLQIVGILFLVGVAFLLLDQVPFINNFLDKIGDYIEIQGGYIY